MLSGTLIFSDGSSISVGALPNDGTALTVDFPTKSVTWVNFNINSAVGENTGLAEIEVYQVAGSPGNTSPSITSGPTASPSTITNAQTATLSVTASDADGDPLSYSWSTTGGSVSGSGSTAVYTPLPVTVSTVYRVDVVVSDGKGGSVTGTVNVTVNPSGGNTSPSITSGPTASPSTITNAQTATLSVTASDADGDPLSYSWSTTGGSVSGSGSTAVYTPLPVTVSTVYRVDVVVSDGKGGSVTGTVNVTVNPSGGNTSPSITSGPTASPSTITNAQTATLSVTASDADGDPLSYSWSTTGGSVSGSGSTAVYTPLPVTVSTVYRVDVVVSDGKGGSVTGTVNVTVNPSDSGVGTNIAHLATVSASSVYAGGAYGQLASKAVDGVVDGYPGDYTREWASDGQLAGAWIDLEWSTFQNINRVRLYDRVNLTDQVLSGTLIFSDGSSISVGALPNDGTALTVDFPTKSVTWVNFNINSAVGENTGLAEIEVYQVAGSPGNTSPSITSGPTASPSTITNAQTATLSVTASDADGDPLSYSWSTTGGSVSGSGSTAVYTPLPVTVSTVYRVDVVVSDGKGGSVTGTVNVTVNPSDSGVGTNIAHLATVSASSVYAGGAYGQLASKAVDGVVDGYPGDYTREWASDGQLAGAWIDLEWSTFQNINRVRLYDRVNLTDQVLSGTLIFSDGSSISVGALPNDGTALTVDFPTKSVTWVNFNINSAVGENTGLAEIEVFTN